MSIATTLTSLAHAVLVVVKPGVWEAIFGMMTLAHLFMYRMRSGPQLTLYALSGGVEAAVSITVCNMSVIIPAILRALSVGDPFMQEDTVNTNFSTVEIARMTSTRIELVELGVPKTRGTAITDSDELEGATETAAFRRRHSVDSGAKDDRRHRLTTHASEVSLGDSKTMKTVPLAEEPDTVDSFAQVIVKGDQGLKTKDGTTDDPT